MLLRRLFHCWCPIVCLPAFLVCCTMPLAGQEKPATEVPPAPAKAANEAPQPSCPVIVDAAIPTKSTIEARVTGTLEASHQKAGKKLWVNSIYEMDFPGCHMVAGAPIYGTVTAASSSKNPDASELSLEFYAADCLGHDKRPMKLVVIGVLAPPGEQARGHNALPTEVQGGARDIGDMAGSSNGYDANLNAAGSSRVVPGSVVGFKNLKLEPQAGPQCSARFTSTDHNLGLPTGTVLRLILRSEKE
jgi:hypothetical protein